MNARGKSKPHELNIQHAKNGGYIVRHSFNNMGAGESYRPPEEHVFADHGSLMSHLKKHTAPNPDADGDEPGDRMAGGPKTSGVGRPMTGKAPGPKSKGAGVD